MQKLVFVLAAWCGLLFAAQIEAAPAVILRDFPCFDEGSGVVRLEVFVDNKLYRTWLYSPPRPAVSERIRLRLVSYAPGTHSIMAHCVDAAGNSGWASDSFTK